MFGILVGACVPFFLVLFRPAAGPAWMWAGGRNDIIRSLYFHPNGSFRRYGRAALFLTLTGGSCALAWLLPLG